MSWVKEANKLGRYMGTRHGYRVYCTKEPQSKESIVAREDGLYRCTDFIPGEYVAINKEGQKLEAVSWGEMVWRVEHSDLIKRFDKRK